jgi:hypothetical protein
VVPSAKADSLPHLAMRPAASRTLPHRSQAPRPTKTAPLPPSLPPGYLAHLAAFRGRLMLDVPDSGSESSRGSGGGKPRPLLTIKDDYSDACMFYI